MFHETGFHRVCHCWLSASCVVQSAHLLDTDSAAVTLLNTTGSSYVTTPNVFVMQAQDYRIQYDSIVRLFILPKSNVPQTMVVISLDPPIRKGQTYYPHILCQFNNDEELNVELDITEEQLQDKNEKVNAPHFLHRHPQSAVHVCVLWLTSPCCSRLCSLIMLCTLAHKSCVSIQGCVSCTVGTIGMADTTTCITVEQYTHCTPTLELSHRLRFSCRTFGCMLSTPPCCLDSVWFALYRVSGEYEYIANTMHNYILKHHVEASHLCCSVAASCSQTSLAQQWMCSPRPSEAWQLLSSQSLQHSELLMAQAMLCGAPTRCRLQQSCMLCSVPPCHYPTMHASLLTGHKYAACCHYSVWTLSASSLCCCFIVQCPVMLMHTSFLMGYKACISICKPYMMSNNASTAMLTTHSCQQLSTTKAAWSHLVFFTSSDLYHACLPVSI